MTYDNIIIWIEKNGMGDFDSYDDLDEFHTKYDNVKKNLPGTAKHVKSFQERMDEYLDGTLVPKTKPSYEDIRSSIESKKLSELGDMGLDDAQTELDNITKSPHYSSSFISNAEAIVRDKAVPPDISEAISDVREQIVSAEKAEDLEGISTGEIKREYGEEARKQVASLLAEARTKFKSEAEEFIDSLTPQISSAATLGELNRLERRASDAPSLRSEDAILNKINLRRSELKSLETGGE